MVTGRPAATAATVAGRLSGGSVPLGHGASAAQPVLTHGSKEKTAARTALVIRRARGATGLSVDGADDSARQNLRNPFIDDPGDRALHDRVSGVKIKHGIV